MRLRQPNMLFALALALAADFAHGHERRAGGAADFLEREIRSVATMAQRHPGARRAQRPLRDRGVALRSAQGLAAAAAAQRPRSARFELDGLADPPRLPRASCGCSQRSSLIQGAVGRCLRAPRIASRNAAVVWSSALPLAAK